MSYVLGLLATYLFLRLAGLPRSGAGLIALAWPIFLLCAPLAILLYPIWYIARIAVSTE